jgi:hypothetical protein
MASVHSKAPVDELGVGCFLLLLKIDMKHHHPNMTKNVG